jgi:inorganic triphosphatase YgiF
VYSVYFDTPGLVLKQHAMALRLRKVGGKWGQTLKTAGTATGGLHQRGEWEHLLRAPQLDLALFRETPLVTLAQSKALHLTLKPAFTTEFYRTTWQVEISPGQRVEVALDQGFILCGSRKTTISEVEIELLEGNVGAVFEVALALAGQIAMKPEILGKAERGYRLFQPEPLAPRRTALVELKRSWPLHQAMQAIVTVCLDHFGANVEGALASTDPEYIHQLRVALRRLRSAMRIFRPADDEHIAAELKWLTSALGDARDWDVLMTETLPAVLDAYGDPALATDLIAAATRRQADARDTARAALASTRETLLVLTMGRWIGVPGELALLPARHAIASHVAQTSSLHPLSHFASHEIRRRHRRLLRPDGGVRSALADLSPEARHRVRIDVKRLRYAVDFFSSLLGNKRMARYVKILGEIQDLLGETNDDAIAVHLVESLAAPGPFAEFARGWFAARTQTRLADVDRRIADLKDLRRVWVD